MKLGMQVGLGAGHIVLDGDPAPHSQKGSPQFSAHICCGQMAGWIKMKLGREIGLIPSDIVLDGDPASPSPEREQSPQFSAHVTLVRRIQPVEIFRNVSSSFGTLATVEIHGKFYGDRPRGTAPSEALNTRGVAKDSDFGPIDGYISETLQDRR